MQKYIPRSPSSALSPLFGEGSPTKIDYRKKTKSGTLFSNLPTGGPSFPMRYSTVADKRKPSKEACNDESHPDRAVFLFVGSGQPTKKASVSQWIFSWSFLIRAGAFEGSGFRTGIDPGGKSKTNE